MNIILLSMLALLFCVVVLYNVSGTVPFYDESVQRTNNSLPNRPVVCLLSIATMAHLEDDNLPSSFDVVVVGTGTKIELWSSYSLSISFFIKV